jgi:serine O-acetyltransferase
MISKVLKLVQLHTTVAGVPAKVVGKPSCKNPCETMQQDVMADGEIEK